MGSHSQGRNKSYDYSFKILLIGDSGVGKSSLLLSFISNMVHDLSPTIGVDFKVKLLTIGGKRLKLTIWDTAGQERFGTLTSSYYRGSHGIILVYDVTRRETFTNVLDIWAKEVQLYSTNHECIKILLGNKVDRETQRAVTSEEGLALAQEHKWFFLECSAKTRENVQQCFKDLTLKLDKANVRSDMVYCTMKNWLLLMVMPSQAKDVNLISAAEVLEVPSLLENGSAVVKRQILAQKKVDPRSSGTGGCCS